MLAKNLRLNLKKDFKWVALGKKIHTKFATTFIRYGDNQRPRVGIAINSKFFPKSTQRNRVRRVVSVFFEKQYNDLPLGINIIVLPKREALDVKSDLTEADFTKVFENENIINKQH